MAAGKIVAVASKCVGKCVGALGEFSWSTQARWSRLADGWSRSGSITRRAPVEPNTCCCPDQHAFWIDFPNLTNHRLGHHTLCLFQPSSVTCRVASPCWLPICISSSHHSAVSSTEAPLVRLIQVLCVLALQNNHCACRI